MPLFAFKWLLIRFVALPVGRLVPSLPFANDSGFQGCGGDFTGWAQNNESTPAWVSLRICHSLPLNDFIVSESVQLVV